MARWGHVTTSSETGAAIRSVAQRSAEGKVPFFVSPCARRWRAAAGRATFASMPVENATVSVKGRVLYLTSDPELLK
ncbi:MAG TPA: hypothetical protein VK540_31725, partial [Polyangiaceae bacterium]|nr:hypothetical protein [Polyangiaceae bacterium]